jgi:hypothetical protein
MIYEDYCLLRCVVSIFEIAAASILGAENGCNKFLRHTITMKTSGATT